MRRLGHRVADIVAGILAAFAKNPLSFDSRALLGKELHVRAPAMVSTSRRWFQTLERSVFPYHAREPHPGFLAYVPSCPTFPALLGDWIATGYNFFAGVWPVAAGPNEIEVVVLDWFREWMGMPPGSRRVSHNREARRRISPLWSLRDTLATEARRRHFQARWFTRQRRRTRR